MVHPTGKHATQFRATHRHVNVVNLALSICEGVKVTFFLGELKVLGRVLQNLAQAVDGLDLLLDARATPQDLLGFVLVVPKPR